MYPANKDCFAHTINGRCNALNVMLCSTKGGCPFYKPSSQVSRDKIESDITIYGSEKLLKEMQLKRKGVSSYG